jgi:hypothetical protein
MDSWRSPNGKKMSSLSSPTSLKKTAKALAQVGMLLVMALLIADFINLLLGVMRDIVPMVMLLRSLIYKFASLAVTVFFWVLRRRNADHHGSLRARKATRDTLALLY